MPVREISAEALRERLEGPPDRRPALLDVRTEGEHQIVALPESQLIPLHELEDRQDELDELRGREVVVYCHHGIRSLSGAAFLEALGIDAVSLAGGIEAYARRVDPRLPRY